MKTHKDLDVWKKSVDLVIDIYNLTNSFPKDELYGLTNQIRRSAVSIPSNIAEGAGRNHNKEFIQFLYIALGSCTELETQLIISVKLKFADVNITNNLINNLQNIRMMILGLIKAVKSRDA